MADNWPFADPENLADLPSAGRPSVPAPASRRRGLLL